MRNFRNTEELPRAFRRALDPQTLAADFEGLFRREYPALGLEVTGCRVGQVYHKPGKACEISYHLQGYDREKRPYENWFHGKLAMEKMAPPTLPQPGSWPGCGFWKPQTVWPEMNMILYAFPYDPKLPYLGQLLESAFVKKIIAENLSAFGLSDDWSCQEVTCQPVKYRFGKSCTLRYQVEMSNGGANQKINFYSKTYHSNQSRYVYDVLRRVCESPRCNHGPLQVPPPIVHLDDANTFWQAAWEGQSLSKTAKRSDWAIFFEADFAGPIAALLAALHQIDLENIALQAGPSLEQVIEAAREDMKKILQFLPQKSEELARVQRTLEKLAAGWREPPQRLIHGAFKLTQLLFRDDQLALVDFDAVACGDPLYDVGEFIASLEYLNISDDVPSAKINSKVEQFLTQYRQAAPWECARERIAFYVLAFLLGKIHSTLKKLEARASENLPAALDLLTKWLKLAEGSK